jgi:Complex 1 protein (LYR family)
VLAIYDLVSLGEDSVKRHIRNHFYANAHVKDERVIDMLLEKAYFDLEETLLQYKQKTNLMLLLDGPVGTHQNLKVLSPDASEEEQFLRIS